VSFKNLLRNTGSAGAGAGLTEAVGVAIAEAVGEAATEGVVVAVIVGEATGEGVADAVAAGEIVGDALGVSFDVGDAVAAGEAVAVAAAATGAGPPTVVIVGKIFPDNKPPVNIRYNATENTAPLMGERKMPNRPCVSIENR
jgi:hypothetical protein